MILMTAEFAKLASREGVGNAALMEAVRRAEQGSIDARLGLCPVKQRIARPGGGRSGGYRAILFVKTGENSVFLHLFAKNRQANLDERELAAYRDFAKVLAGLTTEDFAKLIEARGWKTIE